MFFSDVKYAFVLASVVLIKHDNSLRQATQCSGPVRVSERARTGSKWVMQTGNGEKITTAVGSADTFHLGI